MPDMPTNHTPRPCIKERMEDEFYRRMGGGICRLYSPFCEATAPAAIGNIAAGKVTPRSSAVSPRSSDTPEAFSFKHFVAQAQRNRRRLQTPSSRRSAAER
jgi:hypothetical protein